MTVGPSENTTLVEQLAWRTAGTRFDDLPHSALAVATDDLIDATGLCVAARNSNYMRALLDGWEGIGECSAIGHARALDAPGAALVNGTAIHGEDFDDTLEGAPLRLGAIVIPAVLAAAERHGLTGRDAMRGTVVGLETLCRINTVVPGAIHRAGFHPVGVLGPLGAAAGVASALGLEPAAVGRALGIAASFSSGTLAYLDDASSTKRLHPGWAAHSGYRAALLGRSGFGAPRFLFEGEHSFFRAFAPSVTPQFSKLLEGWGDTWLMERIAFKPYPCGTMIHPYIDCMLQLRERGVAVDEIVDVECETGEGLVHRLWEPLPDKQHPASGYAGKFSMPYCMAVAFIEGKVGLAAFSDDRATDAATLRLASRIRYVIDPDNEYPANYSGHVRARLRDGSVHEVRQPHLRGGAREPLGRDELVAKFRANIAHGGWPAERGEALLSFFLQLAAKPTLDGLGAFRA